MPLIRACSLHGSVVLCSVVCLGTRPSPVICILAVAVHNTSLMNTTSLGNCDANQQLLCLCSAVRDGVLVLSQGHQALCCKYKGIKISKVTFCPAEGFTAFAHAGITQGG